MPTDFQTPTEAGPPALENTVTAPGEKDLIPDPLGRELLTRWDSLHSDLLTAVSEDKLFKVSLSLQCRGTSFNISAHRRAHYWKNWNRFASRNLSLLLCLLRHPFQPLRPKAHHPFFLPICLLVSSPPLLFLSLSD